MQFTKTLRVGAAFLLLALQGMAEPAPAQTGEFVPEQILALMRRVADWGLTASVSETNNLDLNKDKQWRTGVFRTGVMAAYRATKDDKYLKNTIAWGEVNEWKLEGNGGGDSSCAGQAYCEAFLADPKPENVRYYADTKEHFERFIINNKNFNGYRTWPWQDSLFMGTPVVALLGKITGNEQYYERLVSGFNDASVYLYNSEHHLWYFKDIVGLKTTPKGNPQFWGRGNGWVMGALTRDLTFMPNDFKRRSELLAYYKDMCAVLAPKQQADGFWRTGLFEPTEFPNPDSSCTTFFVFAMGRGVLEGWLDKETYLPVVRKGWAALVTAVDASGKLGRCQPATNKPGGVGKSGTSPEACGAFLLAGEVIHELAEKGFLK
jgi:unsaturated rhamnogalacturonyl hydrolase